MEAEVQQGAVFSPVLFSIFNADIQRQTEAVLGQYLNEQPLGLNLGM